MSNDTSPVPSSPRFEAALAVTGPLTVVLFGCGLLFGDLLGTTNYPALNASSFQLREYFMRNVSEVRALSLFHLLAGGPAIGVPLALTAGAFAAAIRRERTLPRWLWWLSTVAGVLGVATVTTLLGPTNNSSAAYGLLLLGAVALFAWLAASSAVLLRRALRAEDRAVDPR